MPGKWDQYEDEADERKGAKYKIGGCHDVEGDWETVVSLTCMRL
jgi:hypothetical protein